MKKWHCIYFVNGQRMEQDVMARDGFEAQKIIRSQYPGKQETFGAINERRW